jgi:hypothetical protein
MDVQSNPEADLSAPESDESDRVKPWTIKGIRIDIRNAAIAAASHDGLPLGKWFERNIPAIIQHNRQKTRMTVVADQPVIPADPKATLRKSGTCWPSRVTFVRLPESRRPTTSENSGMTSCAGG